MSLHPYNQKSVVVLENSPGLLRKANAKDIRRENTRALAQAIGGISALAKLLGKAQSQISRLIGKTPTKNIGDKLAIEIEEVFHKNYGWLDREHPGITIPLDEYEKTANVKCETVPLINWQEAVKWETDFNKLNKAYASRADKRVPVYRKASPMAYALAIKDESMVAQQVCPTFPVGSTIIVEPNQVPKDGDYVVAILKDANEAVLRQWLVKETACVLQPLNSRYLSFEAKAPSIVCGVVSTLIVPFS